MSPRARKREPAAERPHRIEKLFYRRQDAAFALSLSVRAIDALISDQRLTTRRFGRCVMIPAADVLRVADTILNEDMLQGTAQKRK